MRVLQAIAVLVLLGLGAYKVCDYLAPQAFNDPWRHTDAGWEQTTTWQPLPAPGVRALHPAIVATLEVLLLAMLVVIAWGPKATEGVKPEAEAEGIPEPHHIVNPGVRRGRVRTSRLSRKF